MNLSNPPSSTPSILPNVKANMDKNGCVTGITITQRGIYISPSEMYEIYPQLKYSFTGWLKYLKTFYGT